MSTYASDRLATIFHSANPESTEEMRPCRSDQG